jgi:leucyl aminopeptidase
METMRCDMAGAAAVLFTMKTLAELKLKKNITAIIPLTENLLSNNAFRPGDIFVSSSGKSVEIGNTDAEGRLILADALSLMIKEIKPDVIVDIATLTGSCVVTFGETVAAYLSTDEKISFELESASARTGEKIWRLPLFEDYEDRLKSDIADLNNVSAEKNAGAIVGAVFLKNFIDKTPWAHIDIAGTAWYSKERGYNPKYATGFGVRLLVDLIKNRV